jgi:hypothetical protein
MSWGSIDPFVAFTADFGATTADLPFGPINSPWVGSTTIIVRAIANHLISLTTILNNPNNPDKFTYYWSVERLF